MSDFIQAYEYSNVPFCLNCRQHATSHETICGSCGSSMIKFSELTFGELDELDLTSIRELKEREEKIPRPMQGNRGNSCGCLAVVMLCMLVFVFACYEALPWFLEGNALAKWYGILAFLFIIGIWVVLIYYALKMASPPSESADQKKLDEKYQDRLEKAAASIRKALTHSNVSIGLSPDGEEMIFNRMTGMVRHNKAGDT
ncbi:MAG: hypothetical protein ACPIGG_02185 [Akkermansiaceae bacterium]